MLENIKTKDVLVIVILLFSSLGILVLNGFKVTEFLKDMLSTVFFSVFVGYVITKVIQ